MQEQETVCANGDSSSLASMVTLTRRTQRNLTSSFYKGNNIWFYFCTTASQCRFCCSPQHNTCIKLGIIFVKTKQIAQTITMKNADFWDVTSCRFCRTNVSDEGSFAVCFSGYLLLTLSPVCWFFPPWRWRRYVHPKHQLLQEPRGVHPRRRHIYFMTHLVLQCIN
jgi:hypothetical protein